MMLMHGTREHPSSNMMKLGTRGCALHISHQPQQSHINVRAWELSSIIYKRGLACLGHRVVWPCVPM